MTRRTLIKLAAPVVVGGVGMQILNAAPFMAYAYGVAVGLIAAFVAVAIEHDARLDR